ncbi:MAG: hypothetical protein JOZ17_13965 [Acetobacteraceae bacterium]|nr:hypothetical protein [Acetobacteraceae bacterium]
MRSPYRSFGILDAHSSLTLCIVSDGKACGEPRLHVAVVEHANGSAALGPEAGWRIVINGKTRAPIGAD